MYCVTRQSNYYDSGAYSVEVARDFEISSPGALVAKFAGEFEEYDDPREAVTVAISIRREWTRAGVDSELLTDGRIPFTIAGNGFIYPTVCDGLTAAALRRWAQAEYDAIPKCDRCGDLGATEWSYETGETVLACREYCAEELLNYEDEIEENA